MGVEASPTEEVPESQGPDQATLDALQKIQEELEVAQKIATQNAEQLTDYKLLEDKVDTLRTELQQEKERTVQLESVVNKQNEPSFLGKVRRALWNNKVLTTAV